MSEISLLKTVPRRTVVVFLLAVFFVFTSIGVVSDVFDLGRESLLRFAISTALTGLFCASYAFGGITMRARFWKAFIPLFALQFVTMAMVAHWLPDPPATVHSYELERERLQRRLALDGYGIIIGVSLGYAGFVYVFMTEGRRYIRTQAEKAVLEGEMAAAREIQEVILPASGEIFPGFRVEAVYQPAQQVGGDFFQISRVGNLGLLVVVGDVAGKGLPAALLVSMLVGSVRSVAEYSHDPSLILGKLNDRLMGRTHGGFCTALAAHIADDGQVTIANAGHLSPYLDGREIELTGAFPLGIVSGAEYSSTSFHFPPGSRLMFYSDGVVEATDADGGLFGFDGALAISTSSAAEIAKTAVAFGQTDDITVVTVERLATA